MKANDIFPSKYLKAEDIDQDYTATIVKVVMEELEQKDGTTSEKPIIYFKESQKGMVCNKTNFSQIAKQHGDDTDMWIGKQVVLTVMDVEAFGDIVSAIRIKPARKSTATGAAFQKPSNPEGSGSPAAPKPQGEDLITEFWSEIKKQGLERKHGLQILTENGQDFAAALGVLRSGDLPF